MISRVKPIAENEDVLIKLGMVSGQLCTECHGS